MKEIVNKKLMILIVVLMMSMITISGAGTSKPENNDRGTHTVLIEQCTASDCVFCQYVDTYLPQVEGDWERVSLAHSHYGVGYGYNDDINDRVNELGMISGFPKTYFDGGYQMVSGGYTGMITNLQSAYDSCASRAVADIEMDLNVLWMDDAELQVSIDVINNEHETYDGNLKVYITEIESRWNSYTGAPMVNALLGFSLDVDISIDPSQSWSDIHTWDGDDYGYGDITSDNIKVIAVTSDLSTMHVDETLGVYPVTNQAPIADFSMNPVSPDIDSIIQFMDTSTDPDGTIEYYFWNFGDGTTSTLQNPTHSYDEAGIYTIMLTVEDDGGAIGEISNKIVVAESGYAADMVQTIFDRGFRIMPGWDAYQEFTPTFDTLSFVDLYLSKFGAPTGDIIVQVCEDSGTGTIMYDGIISPDDVPSFPEYAWVSIECGNITISSGEKYCVILKNATGADTHNCIQWGWCDSYPSGSGGPYDEGWFFFRKEGNPTWSPIRDWDFTMITFSLT